MLAGVSEEVTITPPVGTPLLGPVRPSTGVHDDLYARALVLADGETRAAIVCLDLVGLDFALAHDLRAETKRRTGLEFVLLNCSHTHSAPFTIPWSLTGAEWTAGGGAQWRTHLINAVAEAVRQAATSLRKVIVRAGRSPVQIGANRRLPTEAGVVMTPNPQGVVVPWVDVLRLDGPGGAPVALLYSHACHPVAVHATSTLVSADFPGYAARTVRQHLGPQVLPLFAQGCGGSVNVEPLRGGFEAAARAGTALGNAAVRAAEGSRPCAASGLRTASRTLRLPFQSWPSIEECDRALQYAERQLARVEGDGSAREEERWHWTNAVKCLRDLRAKAHAADRQRLRFELHLLALGMDWGLVAMNHEVVAEYQLWIEARSPFRSTMVLAYTNGCETYVPTDADLSLGGYEAGHLTYPSGAAAPTWGAALLYPYRRPLRLRAQSRILRGVESLWQRLG